MDPHEVLGVSPDASEAEVRDAYRTLVRRHHPDRHVGEPPEVQAAEAARMAEVTGAFQLLHDPVALGRWKASQARVGRAPGAEHPDQATTRRPSPRTRQDGFDYRRAAASEFDEDTTGRWSRTPPSPARASPPPPRASAPGGRAGPRRRGRSSGSRWLNRLAWVLLIGMVVAIWVLGTDSGRTTWESLGQATGIPGTSATATTVVDGGRDAG